MPRTIITTCGTSLFKSCCWRYEGLCKDSISEMKDETERMGYESVCNIKLKQALNDDFDLAKEFDPSAWEDLYLRDLPAELASLRVIQRYFEKIDRPLGRGDRVILLHSDTEEGFFCSKNIYYTILNNNLLNGANIVQWRIEGLNLHNSDNFGYALQSIWQDMIELHADNENEYFLNLTGGYKGVTILLGGFAYFRSKVNIFYLHEDLKSEEISIFGFDKAKNKKDRFYFISVYNVKKDQIIVGNEKRNSFGPNFEF